MEKIIAEPNASSSIDTELKGKKRKAAYSYSDQRPIKLKKHQDKNNFKQALDDERFKETEYYFQSGLRKVYPYKFTYTTYCKGRWVGKALLKVFSDEFRAHPKEDYEACITSGSLLVNGERVNADYILKDNDLISNSVHRHETPVLAAPIKIIHQSEGLLVIDKPPSVPVHPCGRYRNNTLAFILAKEHSFKTLHILHRLDRLTSGVLMFGLDLKQTQNMEEQIRDRKVLKEYLCRVSGEFPGGVIRCEEPMSSLSHKIGVCFVDKVQGKPCCTEFQKLSYNGSSSVVLCKPVTGRMHQIRVHLQYLGFPIVNDPIYNHSIFGPEKGKMGQFGKTNEQLVAELIKLHTTLNWLGSEADVNAMFHESSFTDEMALKSLGHYTECNDFKELSEKYIFDETKIKKVENCPDCAINFNDPKPLDLVMFLHALKYKGEGFEFESSMPVWAKPEWNDC